MPEQFKHGLDYTETKELDVADCDVVYVTRIQQERFTDKTEYAKVRGKFVFDKKVMSTMKDKSILMHPLPRVDEINWEVDDDPRAVYFKQSFYGMITRMALISMVVNG